MVTAPRQDGPRSRGGDVTGGFGTGAQQGRCITVSSVSPGCRSPPLNRRGWSHGNTIRCTSDRAARPRSRGGGAPATTVRNDTFAPAVCRHGRRLGRGGAAVQYSTVQCDILHHNSSPLNARAPSHASGGSITPHVAGAGAFAARAGPINAAVVRRSVGQRQRWQGAVRSARGRQPCVVEKYVTPRARIVYAMAYTSSGATACCRGRAAAVCRQGGAPHAPVRCCTGAPTTHGGYLWMGVVCAAA